MGEQTRVPDGPSRSEDLAASKRDGRSREARGSPPARLAAWGAVAAISVATVAVYLDGLSGPFVLDDARAIAANPTIRFVSPCTHALASPRDTTVAPRPVVSFSFAANYAWGKTDPRGYHVLNLALHVLAALALFGVVRRTLLLPRYAGPVGGATTKLAFAVGLLWAVHPLQTEAVTYLAQRGELMVALFYLLTLYLFIRGTRSKLAVLWYSAATVTCVLGMGSNEAMFSAPLIVLLYDRVFLSASFAEIFRRRAPFFALLAATWLVLLTGRSGSAPGGGRTGAGDYALAQFGSICEYLWLCFWPHPLIVDRGIELAQGAGRVVPCALFVALLVAGTILAFRYWPWAGFLGAAFFAILAPSSSLLPAAQTAAEHRMYLALAPLATFLVVAAFSAWQALLARVRLTPSSGQLRWRLAPPLLLAAVAAPLGLCTVARNADYRSPVALLEDALRYRPGNARAHAELGRALLANGELDHAMREFDTAIELQPQEPDHYLNRGNAHAQHGDWVQATQDFDAAVRLDPSSAEAYYSRGNARQDLGQWGPALSDYDRALELKPLFPEAFCKRGQAYARLGQPENSLADLNRALELLPDQADAYRARAAVYFTLGRPEDSIRDYSHLLSLARDPATVYYERGMLYERLNRYGLALQDFNRAIELKPDDAAAYRDRAVTQYHAGQYDRAWADVRMCRKLGGTADPAFVRVLIETSGRSE